jgi:hypothetical protein
MKRKFIFVFLAALYFFPAALPAQGKPNGFTEVQPGTDGATNA